MVVIDPLIDGMTGARTTTSEAMGAQMVKMIREQYPQFDVQPFTAANVAKQPLVLIGTFTGVNAQRKTEGVREAYRICFALLDMKAGKILSKGLAFATPAGVDISPLASFRDAPAFTDDPSTLGYIRTCQGTRPGDPIHALYVDRILGASQVAEAMAAYDAGRYPQALALYDIAQRGAAADQFRVYNGLYLSNVKLGRREPARAAFRKIVEHGLANKRLAVKFLFKPGAVSFADAQASAAYPDWIRAIADQASAANACLEVVGHTSATGPEPLNERLSQLRAQQLKSQLDSRTPARAPRTIASGMGSRQTMVGNGRDDVSDALDRRVEFKVLAC
jgi:outer membrane protein OmpA-like peptidoglycan-associated protein